MDRLGAERGVVTSRCSTSGEGVVAIAVGSRRVGVQ